MNFIEKISFFREIMTGEYQDIRHPEPATHRSYTVAVNRYLSF